jgi:branched-chain amino acid transport system ATP-binding protein
MTAPAAVDILLETRDLTKSFKGFVAVDKVSLQVRRGEIHALIGPNGAGKTTMFNLLTKFLVPTSGTVYFKGRNITGLDPAGTALLGMVRSFQISAVFAHMSVLQNVRVALQRKLGTSLHFWRPLQTVHVLDEQAMALLDSVGLAPYAAMTAVDLPYGRKRALEIATTLALDPELMLLDEPTQGMGHEDVGRVMDLIERVAQHRTILMVEHNMGVVARIASRITVMRRGAVLAEGSYAEVSRDPRVVEAYMGSTEHA